MNMVTREDWTEKKVQLLKDTICKGSDNAELELFIEVCKQTGLNPFMKQIYPVKRWVSDLKKWVMTFQTGIDGYRLIAERSGKYSPGRATEYKYDDKGHIISAVAYVKKQTGDGSWHEISSEAFYSEYVAKKKDGTPTTMWKDKPHIMLGKCAEALALRRAFPAELSGLYTQEEMEQADNHKEPSKALEEFKENCANEGLSDQDIQVYLEYRKDKYPDEDLEETLSAFNESFDKWIAHYYKSSFAQKGISSNED